MKKLTEICNIQYGYPFDSKCFTEDSSYPPLIRIRDVVRGYSDTFYNGKVPEEYYIRKGDYLIGMDGEFNIAPWKSRDALLNQRVCKISAKEAETSIDYIFYFMQKCLKHIEDETPFVTVKHLSAKRLGMVSLDPPPLSEQQSIVRELDLLNDLIAKKRAQVAEYDQLQQSLFYTMFGDPVTNEKGWEVKKLGEVAELKAGKAIKANELTDTTGIGVYKCYGGNGIRGYISKISHWENLPIIGRQGALCGNVNLGIAPFYATEHAVVVSPEIPMSVLWLYHLLRHLNLPKYAHGVAQPGLSVCDIMPVSIPLPPLPRQQEFAKKVEAIEALKEKVNASIKETQTLLASRMDYYFG